ncbi:MAG: hypothetical protein ACJ8GN_20355 [Longimicrobiaceae bacterium]
MSRTHNAASEASQKAESVEGEQALSADEPLTREERGRQIADALDKLAAMHAFADIDDPVEWQREIRKDRPLPGRDP